MQERNILDVSCVVACYISLMHYAPSLYISVLYTQKLRDPYISFTAFSFFAWCSCCCCKAPRKSLFLFYSIKAIHSACIICLYTYICNICLYGKHVVCDVCFVCICMHNKCLLVISVSFKPIYNQSERKALSFLITTGWHKQIMYIISTIFALLLL